jgi:type IV pilus biogenesis protein CpaD/CtpE
MQRDPKPVIVAGMLVAALACGPAVAAPVGQEPQTPTRAGKGALSTETTVRVRGTIARYDSATRRLRLTTAAGPAEFAVPQTAHVTRRGVAIDAAELGHLAGSSVVVRYYPESKAPLTVKSVHVLATSAPVQP